MTAARDIPILASPALPRAGTSWVRALAIMVLACVTTSAAIADPPGPREDKRPLAARGLKLTNNSGKPLPLDLEFTDSTGRTIPLRDCFLSPTTKEKRPVVMMMMYHRCPILCPKTLEVFTTGLKEMDFTLGSEYNAVIVSIDPRDTPADSAKAKEGALINYGDTASRPVTQSIRDGWFFLSNPLNQPNDNSQKLADTLGFAYRYLPESGQYSHGTAFFVITPDGRISRYFTRLEFPARDVRLALVEAASGKIGSIVDMFTLWCYHYDPAAGSYVLQAMRVMRVGGALTALLLGGLVAWMLRGEMKRRRLAGPPAPRRAGAASHRGTPQVHS